MASQRLSFLVKKITYLKKEKIGGKKMNNTSIIEAYRKGYQKAMQEINTPMKVIQKNWSPSECPRCKKNFSDYEECDDGYYTRAYAMERCPYCGQLLKWHD